MSAPEAEILVVDDEPGIAQLCKRVLERAGFEVEAATQPDDGIAILQQRHIDLLLVDIRMPEMDGFQLMSIARHHQPDLAVVIMTGFGTVETAIEALRQGADGLILKPFEETKELVRSVREALKERENKREVARLLALRPLFNITEALFSETDPSRVLDLVLNAICGHLKCKHVGFYARELDASLLRLLASRGNPLPEEESIRDGGPAARTDVFGISISINSEGPGDPKLQQLLADHRLGSVLTAPMLRNGERSVLMACREQDEPNFSEADIEMFGILARQAAVALENARLYAELRDYVRQVEESQQALIQAEKMAAVGRLTASIAHEINNPLQAVSNSLHLAGRQELDPTHRKKYLELVDGEVERLMGTVQRMLDFYRTGTLKRKPANINELIQRVLELLQQQLARHEIEVSLDLAPQLPQVLVVSNQIQQVFFNIILNAMDAMPEGGQLFIQSGYQNGTVEVLFEDTGPGVPEHIRERIFEPFMSTRENGTGLGMSVSYNILDAHGGSIELLNGRNRGACFRVRLFGMEAS